MHSGNGTMSETWQGDEGEWLDKKQERLQKIMVSPMTNRNRDDMVLMSNGFNRDVLWFMSGQSSGEARSVI